MLSNKRLVLLISIEHMKSVCLNRLHFLKVMIHSCSELVFGSNGSGSKFKTSAQSIFNGSTEVSVVPNVVPLSNLHVSDMAYPGLPATTVEVNEPINITSNISSLDEIHFSLISSFRSIQFGHPLDLVHAMANFLKLHPLLQWDTDTPPSTKRPCDYPRYHLG